MTTDPKEVISSDSEAAEPVAAELVHTYRFQKGNKIAERYQVIDCLGFGGFAEVYHCQDLKLPRTVAVKVLIREEVGLEREMSLPDARAAARLEHPHIVQVIDFSALSDGTPIIIFRYVEGETLEAQLDRAKYRRLALNEAALGIIRQIAEALDHAHGHSVIHRDVKPSNIILDRQQNAYLTDFGLAEVKQPLEGESMLSVDVQQRLSGTIPYMAPEQFNENEPGNERSDLYSLGVVVYEMLTGRFPYHGRDAALMIQIATAEPLPPTEAYSELPQGIEPVLLRALDKDPAKRYPSCKAFAEELAEAAQAYVAANTQYEKALGLLEAKKWREALSAFRELEQVAPGFKETARYLEQAQNRVRPLEFYEKAEKAFEQTNYQEALDALNILVGWDPEYDVADLRDKAREGLAQQKRQTLEEQYREAVQQCEAEKYQDCLDTLAVIRAQEPDYPDPEEIEKRARERLEEQRLLRELYNQGVEQTRQEEWEEATATFQELRKRSPGYQDVDKRLEMARPMARMSALLSEANALFKDGEYAACVDKLKELRHIDERYKLDEVTRLCQQSFDGLYERAGRQFKKGEFEPSLATLEELRERDPEYSGLEELESQNREGIRVRDLRAKLDSLYEQAVDKVKQREYADALDLWEEIQRHKDDLDYSDRVGIERQAKEGLCASLYSAALGALAQGEPNKALDFWEQLLEVDPDYPDSQQMKVRAQAMIERREKTHYWILRVGGGLGALIILVVLIVLIAKGCGGGAAPQPAATTPARVTVTATPTVKLTKTPSFVPTTRAPSVTPKTTTLTPSVTPKATTPTRPPVATTTTPTATGTSTPTADTMRTPTSTRTRTATPTPTATPSNVATARISSSIFEGPGTAYRELDFIAPNEQVTVLGRSPASYGQWFYVRNEEGIEGYSHAPRFDWTGDFEALAVKTPTATPGPSRTSTPGGGPGSLILDIWDLPWTGRCEGAIWHKSVFMEGRDGNGVYTYFWNGELVAGPTSGSITFEVHSSGGAIIGIARVESGDGQVVTTEFYVPGIDCTP